MIPFDPRVGAGITPEILFGEERGDYSYLYVLSSDGSAIRLRYLGPSEALSELWIKRKLEGDEHVIVCGVGLSDLEVSLARWKVDAEGRVRDAWVRTQPVIEIRPFGELQPGQLVVDCEWRPLVDGKGSGPWRR